MTPAARVQAAIEVLDQIVSDTPAEQALTRWARSARYAGSKDRRAVRDHVYDALRQRNSAAALGGSLTGRGLMLGLMRLQDQDVSQIFTGIAYNPDPLTTAEQAVEMSQLPVDLPNWMIPYLQSSLGPNYDRYLDLMQRRAPVMLRVNIAKTAPKAAIAALCEEDIIAKPTQIAETALVVVKNAARIRTSNAYQAGLIELQDGSSQAAMEALNIPAGARVLDFCAGGGGKILALAARHKANWFAHDIAPDRMKDLPTRAKRAGSHIEITDDPAQHAPFDVVLIDVPCSGSGTWRRNPDAKWQLTKAQLLSYVKLQQEILEKAIELLSFNGMLIYTTCSVFDPENSQQIEGFVKNKPFKLMQQVIYRISDEGDGFYLAVLQRS